MPAALLLSLGAAELALRVLENPFHPFTGLRADDTTRLFVPAADGRPWVETAPEVSSRAEPGRRKVFVPDQRFEHPKPDGRARVLCMGASSSAGFPYSLQLAFSSFLTHDLKLAAPGLDFDVINASLIYSSSSDLLDLIPEILEYEPDVLVVYSGNNERMRLFAGGLRHHVQATSPLRGMTDDDLERAIGGLQWSSKLYALRKAWGVLISLGNDPEVQDRLRLADLEAHGTLEDWILGAYRWNISRLVAIAEERGARVVLVTVPLHLRWPPSGPSIFPEEEHLGHWTPLVARALRQYESGEVALAVQNMRQALAIAPGFAPLHHSLARALEDSGQVQEAARHYRLAKRYDLMGAWPSSSPEMNEVLRAIAAESSAILVDADREFSGGGGIPDNSLFSDYCHPSPRGHQIIGHLVAKALLESGALGGRREVPMLDWETLHRDTLETLLADPDNHRCTVATPVGYSCLFEAWMHYGVGMFTEAVGRWQSYRSGDFAAEHHELVNPARLQDPAIVAERIEWSRTRHDRSGQATEGSGPAEVEVSGWWAVQVKRSETPSAGVVGARLPRGVPWEEAPKTAFPMYLIQDGTTVTGVGLDVLAGTVHGAEIRLVTEGVVEDYGFRGAVLVGLVDGDRIRGSVQTLCETPAEFRAHRLAPLPD